MNHPYRPVLALLPGPRRRALRALLAGAAVPEPEGEFADFPALMAHCRAVASPLGRAVLAQFDRSGDARRLGYADTLAAALYLLHRLDHVLADYRDRGRLWLPQDELARFRVAPEQLAAVPEPAAVKRLLDFQYNRARRLLKAGSPLGRDLKGRAGLALRLAVLAAERRIRRKLQHGPADPAALGAADWLGLTALAAYHGLR